MLWRFSNCTICVKQSCMLSVTLFSKCRATCSESIFTFFTKCKSANALLWSLTKYFCCNSSNSSAFTRAAPCSAPRSIFEPALPPWVELLGVANVAAAVGGGGGGGGVNTHVSCWINRCRTNVAVQCRASNSNPCRLRFRLTYTILLINSMVYFWAPTSPR